MSGTANGGGQREEPRPGSFAPGPDSLEGLPRDELRTLAGELGISHEERATAKDLSRLIRQRRELLEKLDRQAMLEVAAWGRRPVKESEGKEELARQIAQVHKAEYQGLSRDGLYVLACLRGVPVAEGADGKTLLQALKSHEGIIQKFNRKRRRWVGKLITNLLGEEEERFRFLPEEKRQQSLKDRIEESGVVRGLAGGLAERLRGAADDYVAVKLDEIEARIDRKLEEIDQRLAQWRDKEIANRLRIIKITLWASVIVALVSLAYAWVVKNVHF